MRKHILRAHLGLALILLFSTSIQANVVGTDTQNFNPTTSGYINQT